MVFDWVGYERALSGLPYYPQCVEAALKGAVLSLRDMCVVTESAASVGATSGGRELRGCSRGDLGAARWRAVGLGVALSEPVVSVRQGGRLAGARFRITTRRSRPLVAFGAAGVRSAGGPGVGGG